jgi:hypothetical protein
MKFHVGTAAQQTKKWEISMRFPTDFLLERPDFAK